MLSFIQVKALHVSDLMEMKVELSPSSWPPFASSEASRKLPTAIESTATSMPQIDNVMDTSSPVLMCEDSTLISVPFVACTTSGKAAILDPTQKLHPIPLSLQSNNAPMIHSAELNIPLDNLVPPMSAMLSSKQPLFSPAARYRRAPAPSHSPPINIVSTSLKHTIDVHLPPAIQPEMVTISANKGDRIKIVADAWHMETDCHYEWVVCFPPHDSDMSAIQAKYGPDGHLTIDVQRRPKL